MAYLCSWAETTTTTEDWIDEGRSNKNLFPYKLILWDLKFKIRHLISTCVVTRVPKHKNICLIVSVQCLLVWFMTSINRWTWLEGNKSHREMDEVVLVIDSIIEYKKLKKKSWPLSLILQEGRLSTLETNGNRLDKLYEWNFGHISKKLFFLHFISVTESHFVQRLVDRTP